MIQLYQTLELKLPAYNAKRMFFDKSDFSLFKCDIYTFKMNEKLKIHYFTFVGIFAAAEKSIYTPYSMVPLNASPVKDIYNNKSN